MSTILINATADELRVAMINKNTLDDFYYEHAGQKQNISNKANIFKARITRIEPGLEAVFVDFGGNRQGFLPFREITSEYFNKKSSYDPEHPASVADLLREGQEIMVQVMKEERGTKGAALTTYITLAGCYLVLMPNSAEGGGISRRIEGDDRQEMKELLNSLQVPGGMSVIIRTAGVDKSQEDLQWDLDILLKQWEAIRQAYHQRPAPFLIHQEGDVTIRTIRDHLRHDVDSIIVDNVEIFTKAKNYIERVRPDYLDRLKLYQDEVPLFARYQVEKLVKTAFDREVHLPSGGSVVIDRTEALISIDINSARATHGSDIEETAFLTNLEAADEIARQLRLRDLGGLIVIDFIDMTPVQHQREVENRLREALKVDRARIQIGRISRFGLLEMSRQRLHPTLGEATQMICPQCHGQGAIRGVEAIAFSILRQIEEDALKPNIRQIRGQLPVEVATFLLNEKRHAIAEIEKRHCIEIMVIPNPYLTIPSYKLEIVNETAADVAMQASYEAMEKPKEINLTTSKQTSSTSTQQTLKPAVSAIIPEKPREETGFMRRIWSALFGTASSPSTPAVTTSSNTSSHYKHSQSSGSSSQHHQRSRKRRGNNRRDRDGNRNEHQRDRNERNERSERSPNFAQDDRSEKQGYGNASGDDSRGNRRNRRGRRRPRQHDGERRQNHNNYGAQQQQQSSSPEVVKDNQD